MNDVHDRWDKMIEAGNKLIQFLGEMLLEKAANIDQSPPQEMSIQDMENLKQHYLDEMLSLSKFNGMSIEINKKKELQHLEQNPDIIKSSVEDLVPIPNPASLCHTPSELMRMSVFRPRYGYYLKWTKTKQNGQNQAREWNECEKSKPKAYTLLMGQPCMQTRSSSKFIGEPSTNPISTNPKRRNRRRSKQRDEPFALEETPVVTMVDQRTMAELLRAPTEGYAEAIVVPPIPAEHFELKHSLINLVTSKRFFGFEKEDPHAYI
ncbi:hypothetical protein Tco_0161457 [Tanacetum coccineum]